MFRVVRLIASLVVLAACSSTNGVAATNPDATSTPADILSPSPSPGRSPTPLVDPDLPTCLHDDAERRWGLHCTEAELAAWRTRARSGPYREPGDERPNSPGDWLRIQDNAQALVDDPNSAVWPGPEGEGCVGRSTPGPSPDGSSRIRDAAFLWLVTGDTEAGDAAAEAVLAQAGQPALEFSDRERWCVGAVGDGGLSFDLADMLTRILYAVDYLGPGRFDQEETGDVEAFLRGGAEFLARDIDEALDHLWMARGTGRQRQRSGVGERCDRINYLDGPTNCGVHRHYNNRRATAARAVGLIGLHFRDEELLAVGRTFVEEMLAYGVWSEGSTADFERWKDDLPDLGWAYGVNTVSSAFVLADAMARAGDPTLWEYTTADGVRGSEGGTKSLPMIVRALQDYPAGRVTRYGTDDPGAAGPGTLIDSIDGGWHSVHDVMFALANRWLRDPEVREVYLREGLGGYPGDPAPNGASTVWTGEGGTFPGILFMFGKLEDAPSPYPDR